MKKLTLFSILIAFATCTFGQSNQSANKLFIKDRIEFKDGRTYKILNKEKVAALDAMIEDSALVGTASLDANPDSVLTKKGVAVGFAKASDLQVTKLGTLTKDTGPDSVLTKSGTSIKYYIIGTTGTVYAAGTAATIPATAAQLNFGTTDPGITVSTAGTYLVYAGADLKLTGYSNDTIQTVTFKLRRTNNTAADLTAASETVTVPVSTTVTLPDIQVTVPPVVYTTANTDDIIHFFGGVGDTPDAGTLTSTSAYIVLQRIK